MTKRKFRLIRTFVTLAVLLTTGGYVYTAASADIPAPQVDLNPSITEIITVDDAATQSAVDGQELPTAISWAETSDTWSNDSIAHPIASIAKLVTMLVCLEENPLEADPSSWPTHIWSAADWQRQQGYIADNGVAYPVPIGAEIPLADMFPLILLASANDMVAAYAYSTFPDNAAFIDAVDDWAHRHEFDSLKLVEPTGMDERNQASTADVIRIARLALESPIITQYTSMASAQVPGFGAISSTNPLFESVPNILGLKTGTLYTSGYNLLVAQSSTIGDREVTKISATLGRESSEARALSGQEMLSHLDALPQTVVPIFEGDEVGRFTDWSGAVISLMVESSAETVLLPGEQVQRSVSLDIPQTANAHDTVGVLTIGTPSEQLNVDIIVTQGLDQPTLWWRLTHPHIIFSQSQ